jgi:hypothetical protein
VKGVRGVVHSPKGRHPSLMAPTYKGIYIMAFTYADIVAQKKFYNKGLKAKNTKVKKLIQEDAHRKMLIVQKQFRRSEEQVALRKAKIQKMTDESDAADKEASLLHEQAQLAEKVRMDEQKVADRIAYVAQQKRSCEEVRLTEANRLLMEEELLESSIQHTHWANKINPNWSMYELSIYKKSEPLKLTNHCYNTNYTNKE